MRTLSIYRRCVTTLLIVSLILPQAALGISIREEEDLSKEVLGIIDRYYKVIPDPIITKYINELGQSMIKSIPPQPFTYHFYVIEEDVYNAFATPAGHVFFNSGLIAALDNEDELAGIMAHEIAHVTNRHISQKIERSKKMQLATLAGMAAGALLGIGGAGAAAQALTIGSAAAGQSAMLAYSRENEFEADEDGLIILKKSGFGAEGLLSGLKIIRSKQWFGSAQFPTYLSTHPASEERIGNLANWIAMQGTSDRKTAGFDPETFRLAQIRIITMYGDEVLAANRFKTAIRDNPEDPMNQYGYGIILGRIGNRKQAVEHLKKALEKRAFDPFILTDLGKVYFLDGRFKEALKTLDGALSIDPHYPEAVFYTGRTYIETGKYAEAVSLLEPLVKKSPGYTTAFYALGEAYGKQKQMGEAHYYLGLFYWHRKDAKNAAFHLRRASKLISDKDKLDDIKKMLRVFNEKSEESAGNQKKKS
jgi:beta-barrel assembly-enhancing protease